MKREKPDPLQLAVWAATHLEFAPASKHRARGLWNHWAEFARKAGVRTGSPRAFSNALRKMGCPPAKDGEDCPRRRWHVGVRLIYDDALATEFRSPCPAWWDPMAWNGFQGAALQHRLEHYGYV